MIEQSSFPVRRVSPAKFFLGKLLLSAVFASAALTYWVVMFSPALAQERLPWGETRRPQSVTPNENPVPRYEPGGPQWLDPRSQNRSQYDRQPNYDAPSDYDRRGQYGREGNPPPRDDTYSDGEIMQAGHGFFGSISAGLAKIIEYSFSQSGRPNGYILGEEAGGAFIAGLRYGEGILHTKDAGQHRVYWQGPSIGYDFGAEGSKTMILVYNLYSPDNIYRTFTGVSGSAYFIGGVGITYQKNGHTTLAPIRAGVGARLGANIGYLKYTRRPTWNPF